MQKPASNFYSSKAPYTGNRKSSRFLFLGSRVLINQENLASAVLEVEHNDWKNFACKNQTNESSLLGVYVMLKEEDHSPELTGLHGLFLQILPVCSRDGQPLVRATERIKRTITILHR